MIGEAKATEFETNFLIQQDRGMLEPGATASRERQLKRLDNYTRKLFEEVHEARLRNNRQT